MVDETTTTSIETIDETYKTYRMLSHDEYVTTWINDIFITIYSDLYIELQFNDIKLYVEVGSLEGESISKSKALLRELVGNPVTHESLKDTELTLKINKELDTATIETETFTQECAVYTEKPDDTFDTQHDMPNDLKTKYFEEFKTKCEQSYWYYNNVDSDGKVTAPIKRLHDSEYEAIMFSVQTGLIETKFAIDQPENANPEDDVSAEFIEETGGGSVRLMEDAEIIITKSAINTSKIVSTSINSALRAFTKPQYEQYVQKPQDEDVYTEYKSIKGLISQSALGLGIFTIIAFIGRTAVVNTATSVPNADTSRMMLLLETAEWFFGAFVFFCAIIILSMAIYEYSLRHNQTR